MQLPFTYKIASSITSKRPENTHIFQPLSTGKEKDSETGYHYFGARYYNSDLSLWLSVDPMSDKYPSLSPYNYCAWNPMKLVDPDGMIIDSASVTQEIKNMINPSHECYNDEFASVYKYLDADKSTVYRFDQWEDFRINSKGQEISGAVSLSDERILTIGFTLGRETELVSSNLAPERALCEEIYHAKQFCDGEFGFTIFVNLPGWRYMGYDESDEEVAHAWAARVSGTSAGYNLNEYKNSIGSKSFSAEDGWRGHYPEERSGKTPGYDINGLHSSSNYYFKRAK
ncbi:MAG: hypothetical protein J5711_07120 [Bacteroidales bacterium]|nr:hypothetical protein [Bacteroidales bacterium]